MGVSAVAGTTCRNGDHHGGEGLEPMLGEGSRVGGGGGDTAEAVGRRTGTPWGVRICGARRSTAVWHDLLWRTAILAQLGRLSMDMRLSCSDEFGLYRRARDAGVAR